MSEEQDVARFGVSQVKLESDFMQPDSSEEVGGSSPPHGSCGEVIPPGGALPPAGISAERLAALCAAWPPKNDRCVRKSRRIVAPRHPSDRFCEFWVFLGGRKFTAAEEIDLRQLFDEVGQPPT